MELVEWLLAVLDEDERVARTASPGPWRPNTEQDEVVAIDDITVCEGFALSNNQVRNTVQHIAVHDPAAVLADIEAKRRLLNLCAEWEAMALASPATWSVLLVCAKNTRRLLASAYAHRSGYRSSWA